eukprot:COSAG01_NODE_2120_length_8375_cov_364.611890_5_plen_409_part_00
MTVKGELRDWLHQTGRDIARAVGDHVREKGIAYAKDQLGMGMTSHMSGQGYEQSGDGLSDWLKESGKEVAKAVGKHLLRHFKDKAVSYAQEHLGNGILDELKKHVKSTAKAIGKSALRTGVSKLDSITDMDSAKAAARDVVASAQSEGKSQLMALANKYFRGSGTPEQAVKVCAYTLSELRKVITQMRRKLAGLSVEDWLEIHAHRAVKPDDDLEDYKRKLRTKPSQGGFTMKTKRQHISQLKKRLHPAVSKMNRRRCVEYIYGTAREMDIDWEQFFEGATERKRVPKNCYKMTGPGSIQADDTHVAAHRIKKASKRAPSAYNEYMKEKLADPSFFPNIPYGGIGGRFARAARLWKRHKAKQAEEARSRKRTAEFFARPVNRKRIPKKTTPARERAKMASMGLPTQFR